MKLGDLVEDGLAEIRTGPFGTQLQASSYVPYGRPVLNVRNVGFGEVRPAKFEYVDEKTAERLAVHLLEQGDIVFGRKGAVERHAFIQEPFVGAMQGSDCIRLRLASDAPVASRFLTFALRTSDHLDWMQRHGAHGATMASLNQDILKRIEIPDVELRVQHRIADVLWTFDDLIENNRRRIEILEEAARSLYREWFVRYRFPGHELAEFLDSSLGPIPSDWCVTPLGEQVEFRYGKALKKGARRGGDVAVVGSSGVVGWHDEALVDGPGVVIGRKGNVGSVTWIDGPFHPIDTTYFVVSGHPMAWIRYLLESLTFRNSHAAVPGLNKDDAMRTRVVVPPRSLVGTFAERVDPVLGLSHALRLITSRLEASRGLVLPRLVTGQVDVDSLGVADVFGWREVASS